MNKTEFVRELSRRMKMTQKDAQNALNAITTLVTQRLSLGDNVNLLGFGKFEIKYKSSRYYFSPKTGKREYLPPTKTPIFKASKALKQHILS